MNKRRITIIYACLLLALMMLAIINLFYGSTDITLTEMVNIISGKATNPVNAKIICDIRIPRIIAAAVLGGALALSGYMLQVFFNNPIAGPFVLGISSGAKLCVALLMLFVWRYGYLNKGYMMVIAAFIGAILATVVVLIVSSIVKNMAILIVCGVMIGYICSAVTELVVTFADDSNIVNLHNWTMGSFLAIDLSDAAVYIPVVVVCVIIAIVMAKPMEAFSYGEGYAASVGINIRLFKVIIILLSSILSATVTAFAGPVSFVGIAVPHLIRTTFKSAKPLVLIPATFLGGAVFCLACDLFARGLFAPTELSISTITAVFGAPVVISLLIRRKRG